MDRLFSRVTIVRSSGSEDSTDGGDVAGLDAAMEGLESGDPRSLARMARQMSDEMGEELPGEYEPMLRRMEAGEMPDDEEFASADGELDDSYDSFDED